MTERKRSQLRTKACLSTRWAGLNISGAADLLGFSCRVCRERPEKEQKTSSEWLFRLFGSDGEATTSSVPTRDNLTDRTTRSTLERTDCGALASDELDPRPTYRHSVRCLASASAVTGSRSWTALWGCSGGAEELQLNVLNESLRGLYGSIHFDHFWWHIPGQMRLRRLSQPSSVLGVEPRTGRADGETFAVPTRHRSHASASRGNHGHGEKMHTWHAEVCRSRCKHTTFDLLLG